MTKAVQQYGAGVRMPLTQGEAIEIARLHLACLPDSLITKLGFRYAARFYESVTLAGDEAVFVARSDTGKIAAASLLSLDPDTLIQRLRKSTPLAKAVIAHPRSWVAVIRSLLDSLVGSPADDSELVPEVVLLFTDESARGQGCASALLTAVEDYLRTTDHRTYCVKTEQSASNPAIAFYRNRGFVAERMASQSGTQFVVLTKTFGAEARKTER